MATASNKDQGQSSSSSTVTPLPPTPVLLRNARKDERYFILNRYGECPSVVSPITGPTGGIPVYRAVKVKGESTEQPDTNRLVVSLKCLYARGEPGSNLHCSALYIQHREEIRNSHAFTEMGDWCLVPVTSSFTHVGDDGVQYECVEFPYLREGSLHSFMAQRFPRGVPEDVILYVLGKVVQALSQLHSTNRAHGQVCAAHVMYFGSSRFQLVYGATNVDLDSDRDSGKCQVWRWALAPEIYDGTVRCDISDEVLKTDIWMVGVLALEMAYSDSGLSFTDRDAFYQRIEEITRRGKLPKNLVGDVGPQRKMEKLKNLIKGNKPSRHDGRFSKKFEAFVFDCLERKPAFRPSARSLRENKWLTKYQSTHVPEKYSF